MSASYESAGEPVRISPQGQMDSASLAVSRREFEAAAASADRDVVLDLSGVEAMDGAGVGAVAHLYKRLAARGLRLRVEGASGQPLALLRQLGVARLLSAERRGRCGRETA